MSLSTWYHVSFDGEKIYRETNPPNGEEWNDELFWKDIIRVCFKAGEDLFDNDEIYIFTDKRDESYLIPTMTDGGAELWGEIIDRGLFDAELGIKVATGLEGLHCWPEGE